jgi:DNA polymerase/3'-5' exonuclease PolX
MTTYRPTNEAIADALEQLGDRLAEREANPHRVHAYHAAAESVRQAERPLVDLLEEGGLEAIKRLPGIGESLAARIGGFVQTARLQLLEEFRNEFSPADVFARLPGVGPELAQRIHAELGIRTLEELELATHDGRLDAVEGFGPRRVRALRDQLNTLLTRRGRRRSQRFQPDRARGADPYEEPLVEMLLSVDREYRHRAGRNELEMVAPRRFNPTGEAWLPLLRTHRPPWRFTALFSNTARAHELGKTHDWVVVYGEREGREQQYTVVTEVRGELRGERVVRGREAECRAYYEKRRRGILDF